MSLMQYLRDSYPYDPQRKIFTIDAAVDTYDELYNYLDPSPSPSRDLAPDVVEYLNQCSEEIPLNYGIRIVIHIQEEPRKEDRERECLASIKTYYQHETILSRLDDRQTRIRSLRYVAFSLLCLTIYLLAKPWAGLSLVTTLLHEAFLVGGWVFMWEAVSINFIETDPPRLARQRFKRLVEAPIEFTYAHKTD